MHPVTERAIISRLGLALEEPPHTNPGMSFESGDIYSVRVGITNSTNEHVIVSAMVRAARVKPAAVCQPRCTKV